MIRSLILILLLTGANSSFASSVDPAITTLFQLVNKRLSYMEDVAKYKWINNIPIEDQQREIEVIRGAVNNAGNFGLESQTTRVFFEQQIDAAKEIQQAWFNQWNSQQPPRTSIDLKTQIRPQLLSLGNQIVRQIQLTLQLLKKTPKPLLEQEFIKVVTVAKMKQKTRINLLHALSKIETVHSNNLLESILSKKELLVGTTGDYAPFSLKTGHQFEGIDIDLAKDLAESLGVKLILVETSWPTLSEDFKAKKFDIAMSGVSITLKRRQHGFFSKAYHSGGKTPISRCQDVSRFDSFEKIDQSTTQVIVNPGGTNFKFAESKIENASIQIFDNNETIFQEISDGNADLMITDAIEVMLQSNQNYKPHKLCASMPGKTLTKSEKGFWLQADTSLKEYVNGWLHQRKIEGVVDTIFQNHLAQKN